MEDEYVFAVRYKIIKESELKNKKGNKLVCIVYGHVKPEDTKVNDDIIIALRVCKKDTKEECLEWVEGVSKTLGQWYLDVEIREFLKANLSDENFQFLLDEEAELLKEPKNA